MMIKNFEIVRDSGTLFSVNNILGFPHETPELAFDTIYFNREIEVWDRNTYPFTPFHGTPLRTECEKLGYLKDEDIVQSVVVGGSIFNIPQFPKEKIDGIVKTFNMYVNFPKSRWPILKKLKSIHPKQKRSSRN